MRIISGKLGGRRISSKLPAGIRPTTDRVKESLFSVLDNRIDFEGITILDLFSGAGSLWIEAISRGGNKAISVDNSALSLNFQKKISMEIRVDSQVSFVKGNAITLCDKLISQHQPHLVFADPPYNKGLIKRICDSLADYTGIIVIESSVIESPLAYLTSLGFDCDAREYGDSVITFASK